MAEDFNFTSEELAILAPRQNLFSAAFKGGVSMGATVFFGEKIAEKFVGGKLLGPEGLVSNQRAALALSAALVGGAAAGVWSAHAYNAKLTRFTDKLKQGENATGNHPQR